MLKSLQSSLAFTIAELVGVDHDPLLLPGLVYDEASFLDEDVGYDCAWEHDDEPSLEVHFTSYTVGSGESEYPDDKQLNWIKEHLDECISAGDYLTKGHFLVRNPFYFDVEE